MGNNTTDVSESPVVKSCSRCDGAGWVWWDELDSYAGHDPAELVIDDTKYTCDKCEGSGKNYECEETI